MKFTIDKDRYTEYQKLDKEMSDKRIEEWRTHSKVFDGVKVETKEIRKQINALENQIKDLKEKR